jgi:hypothetical protein
MGFDVRAQVLMVEVGFTERGQLGNPVRTRCSGTDVRHDIDGLVGVIIRSATRLLSCKYHYTPMLIPTPYHGDKDPNVSGPRYNPY